MKKHLACQKGDIASCKKVPADVQHRMKECLNKIAKEKEIRQAEYEIENPFAHNVSSFESDDVGYSQTEVLHKENRVTVLNVKTKTRLS